MKTILVTKSGMSFVPRTSANLNSSTGEQGETEGVLRYLMSRGDINVVYFGRHRGDMTGLCHHAISPTIFLKKDDIMFGDKDAVDKQKKGFEKDIEALKDFEPIAVLNVLGPPATMSMIDNPRFATVQMQGVAYTAPMINALQHFKIPRVCINNDPRTYPRDQEMTYQWPYARPVALLDQCNTVTSRIVGGVEYTRESYLSWAESWAYLPKEIKDFKRTPCKIVAHAHIADGTKQRGRAVVWQQMLGDKSTWPSWLEIYGAGWEHYADYDPRYMRGVVRPDTALDMMNEAYTTPCVSAAPYFNTGKAFVALSRGCLPLLWSGEDPYAWDLRGYYLHDKHPLRVTQGTFFKAIDYAVANRAELLEECLDRFVPNYAVLNLVIDDLLKGTFRNFEYGGYL